MPGPGKLCQCRLHATTCRRWLPIGTARKEKKRQAYPYHGVPVAPAIDQVRNVMNARAGLVAGEGDVCLSRAARLRCDTGDPRVNNFQTRTRTRQHRTLTGSGSGYP
jgi:hypothetical protein